ncbi:MAG: 30S ribosomal protein S14 [Nanoarchaeota archaeon]|nr:30S ribosomal protein S14 [Nanoarchaeota archaeon]
MTASSHKKMFKQLKNKPEKLKKYKKFNAPKKRTTGINLRPCKLCGRIGGNIQAYGLNICRQCFRENAKKLGFKKYR